ncbi:hypothetical protein COT75_03810 [Candidatus Beckwithbacteria bacterium CG10_big_fil_rev_8_21_14_0_10_34_10]|uniref:Uncharacterized protein n=1 Tax=Candidatus Beckwithbacteria bacterium CG10_big_fil_rev_8_21_14_0_10_34_10 TaxID=1974495 RepID=A0A2H0W8I1_9BACT|nr:MAG: hypothetical protein COT75_03810 [Candidatus Beckwithbacteria bacterium CG10_big_fil_rev_8_21_14_0_10_34_10]
MKKKKFFKAYRKLDKLRGQAASSLSKKHKSSLKHFKKKKLLLPGLDKPKRLLAGATLAGSLFLNPGGSTIPKILDWPVEEISKLGLLSSYELNEMLKENLTSLLPGEIGKLTKEQEEKICEAIEKVLGIDVCANLEGNELNYAYGWIGYEQHLYRYPGDTLDQHDEELVAGIAPGLGAWGYFADSKAAMTEEEKLREKYYSVVQTLYLPEWQTNSEELYQWYKYRKVIIVNPENGTACVTVIGDAGPAKWTGKQFGGSPEVMKSLDLNLGMRKGKVFVLFVKDEENKIPLGPIDFNIRKGLPKLG